MHRFLQSRSLAQVSPSLRWRRQVHPLASMRVRWPGAHAGPKRLCPQGWPSVGAACGVTQVPPVELAPATHTPWQATWSSVGLHGWPAGSAGVHTKSPVPLTHTEPRTQLGRDRLQMVLSGDGAPLQNRSAGAQVPALQ